MNMFNPFSAFRIVFLFAVAAVAGFFLLPKLDIDLLPPFDDHSLQVSFNLPNSSPLIVERNITSVLEGVLSQLGQLKKIESLSRYDNGNIDLFFDDYTDMDYKRLEVAALIRRSYERLPSGCSYPMIGPIRETAETNDEPLLMYTIDAPDPSWKINREAAATFRKDLSLLQGVRAISISGQSYLQVCVEYDRLRCEAWNISREMIAQRLDEYARAFYPGSYSADDGHVYFMFCPAGIDDLSAVEDILIRASAHATIKLKQLAKIYIREQKPASYLRVNGNNSITLSLIARPGVNRLGLANAVKKIISVSARKLPPGFHVNLAYDGSEFMSGELHKNYQRIVLSILILVALIAFSYRDWKYLLLWYSGFLMTVFIGILFLWLFGSGIHLYSIAGLAISFGLITDNLVLMTDYYHQQHSRRVFPALLASTILISAALCAIYFLAGPGQEGFKDFAGTVALALASSLLTCFFFIPGMHRLVFSARARAPCGSAFALQRKKFRLYRYYHGLIGLAGNAKSLLLFLLLMAFGIPVFLLPASLSPDQKNALYRWTIGSNWFREHRVQIEKCLGGTWRLFAKTTAAKSGYRQPAEEKIILNAELPYGHTIDQIDRVLSDFETFIARDKSVNAYITKIHSAERGSIEINFKKEFLGTTAPGLLKSALISKTQDWGGVFWSVHGVGRSFNNTPSEDPAYFRIVLKGYQYEELEKQAGRMKVFLSNNDRIQKININEKLYDGEKQGHEYMMHLDEYGLAVAGTSKQEILKVLTNRAQPEPLPDISLGGSDISLLLKERNSENFSDVELLNASFLLDSNRSVQLRDLAGITWQETAGSIRKEDRQYIRVVSFEYLGPAAVADKYVNEMLEFFKNGLPMGYSASLQYAYWNWTRDKNFIWVLLFLFLVCFYICAVLLEDLQRPFPILLTIPVSFIGLFLSFSVGHFYFDQGGIAAFVVVGGMAGAASIFLVSDYKRLLRECPGRHPNRILTKAAFNRSRTIVLAIVSTLCGSLPYLADDRQEVFWFAFAAGTVGGLLAALPAVLLVLPAVLWRKNQ